jgi:hypothetical protein
MTQELKTYRTHRTGICCCFSRKRRRRSRRRRRRRRSRSLQLQTEVLFVLHRRDHTTLYCKTKPKASKAASVLFSS